MNDPCDSLIEVALREHFGAGPAADLHERILAASHVRGAAHATKSPRRLGLQIAGMAAAAALIGWAVFAPGADLPESVKAAGEYTVYEGEIEARSGWYVLENGSPPMRHTDTRVENVSDRVLVKTGDIPDETELNTMTPWLKRWNLEEDMRTARWIKAGSVAVCLLAGSVTIDGNVLNAQAMERKRVQELERELEDARQQLAEAEAEARRQADGAATTTGVIQAINGKRVRSIAELREVLDEQRRAGVTKFVLTINEGGVETSKTFTIPRTDASKPLQSSNGESSDRPENDAANPTETDGPEQPEAAEQPRKFDLESEIARALREKEAMRLELELVEREVSPGERRMAKLMAEQEAEFNNRKDMLARYKWLRARYKWLRDGKVDAVQEIRKLLNDKDVELANLKSQPNPDPERICEVEASMAALQLALEALENQKDETLTADEIAAGWTTYTIRHGDSWWKIAHTTFKDRDLSVVDYERANPGVELRAGVTVKIPPR